MVEQADMSMTASAMEGGQSHAGDETLLVKFYDKPRLDTTKSEAEGRQIWVDAVYINIMVPGNKDNIIDRPAMDMDKTRFHQHWSKFQARESQDAIEGTLLSEWPAISRTMVEEFKFFNIRTIEQLLATTDGNTPQIMGIAALKKKAAQFMEAADQQKAANDLAARDEQIAALTAKVDGLLERVEGLLSGDNAKQPAVTVTALDTAPDTADETAATVDDSGEKPARRRKKKVETE